MITMITMNSTQASALAYPISLLVNAVLYR